MLTRQIYNSFFHCVESLSYINYLTQFRDVGKATFYSVLYIGEEGGGGSWSVYVKHNY